MFRIRTRASGSRARTGTLRLAHGDVRTPAFVPLATKGAVKTLEPREVAALGYELILGNTFHLLLAPGPELVREFGGLHEFMRWRGPIITDSGGFQVFSMGHGGVADEIKGRRRAGAEGPDVSTGAILSISEDGVRFRSYVDGRERFLSPEASMSVQAALGSDIALAFDECTPFHVSREYTERSMVRTHRWLERCLRWHAAEGPAGQVVYGIVQGGVDHELRRVSSAFVASTACDGLAIGGSLGRDKAQMHEVVSWTTAELERLAPDRPRHLLGIGDVDDLIAGVELGIDTFDCALPTRLGRHGVALVPDPGAGWRVDLVKGRWRQSREPILDGCGCPACAGGFSRAYLHYLMRARELTALRLVTQHNLWFIARLMEDLRAGVDGERLDEVASALRGGAVPGAFAGADAVCKTPETARTESRPGT
ncbi:MAG: tRNA guanosine(34) transglycosylase Tgt [Solirubrobacterales bacterium]|nr:tRNA guanosine(34) transglycosylase Tgt [Solirubrobacterales bacterium]